VKLSGVKEISSWTIQYVGKALHIISVCGKFY